MDSDSDDDLLPNFNTLNEMFSKVHQQVRQAAPVVTPPSTKTKQKPSTSKEKIGSKKTKGKTSKSSSSDAKVAKKSTDADVEISDSTKSLLAEIGRLKNPVTDSSPIIHEAVQTKSGSPSPPNSVSSETVTTRSRSKRGRGRGRGKKVSARQIETIELPDEDDSLEAYCPTLDNSSLQNGSMDVEPVEDLYSIRIRWKQEVLKFKVPVGTKMANVRMQLAESVSTRADNLVILDEVDSEEVSDNTSVESIPFGKTLEAFEKEINESNLNIRSLGPGYVLIKLQGIGGYRRRYSIPLKRTTHVKQLIEDYKEKFALHGKQFKLIFDGDVLELTETPDSLELEHNDMIDIVEI